MTSTNTNTGLRVRVVESTRASQPAKSQIDRAVLVGMLRVAARLTYKLRTALAVGFVYMATTAALLAGVSRVNPYYRDTSALRLVGQELSQLCERPAMQCVSLRPSSPDPTSDASEFLNGYASIGAFGERYNAFRDGVIHVARKERFLAGAFLQKTFGGLCAFALELATKCFVPVTNLVQLRAAIPVAIAIGGDLRNAEVHAKKLSGGVLGFFRHFDTDVQIPVAVAQNEVGFTAWELQEFSLLFAANEWQGFEPTSNRPNAHGGGRQLEVENPRVVGDATQFAEHPLLIPVELVGIGDFRQEAHHDLRGQRELISDGAIAQPMQWKLTELFIVPCQLRNPVGGGIGGFQRRAERSRLAGRRQQFKLDGQLHANRIVQISDMSTPKTRNDSAALKGGVSNPRIF